MSNEEIRLFWQEKIRISILALNCKDSKEEEGYKKLLEDIDTTIERATGKRPASIYDRKENAQEDVSFLDKDGNVIEDELPF